MILDALEGRRTCVSLGDYIQPIQENPHDISAWINLVDRIRTQAVSGCENHDYAEILYREALDVCKKALKLNPKSTELMGYIDAYKQYLDIFRYSIE